MAGTTGGGSLEEEVVVVSGVRLSSVCPGVRSRSCACVPLCRVVEACGTNSGGEVGGR